MTITATWNPSSNVELSPPGSSVSFHLERDASEVLAAIEVYVTYTKGSRVRTEFIAELQGGPSNSEPTWTPRFTNSFWDAHVSTPEEGFEWDGTLIPTEVNDDSDKAWSWDADETFVVTLMVYDADGLFLFQSDSPTFFAKYIDLSVFDYGSNATPLTSQQAVTFDLGISTGSVEDDSVDGRELIQSVLIEMKAGQGTQPSYTWHKTLGIWQGVPASGSNITSDPQYGSIRLNVQTSEEVAAGPNDFQANHEGWRLELVPFFDAPNGWQQWNEDNVIEFRFTVYLKDGRIIPLTMQTGANTNPGIYAVDDTTEYGTGGGGAGGDPPDIVWITTPGMAIRRNDPIRFYVEDEELRYLILSARFVVRGFEEVIYRVDRFAEGYKNSTVETTTPGGKVRQTFTVYRISGWIDTPTIQADAIDIGGQLA